MHNKTNQSTGLRRGDLLAALRQTRRTTANQKRELCNLKFELTHSQFNLQHTRKDNDTLKFIIESQKNTIDSLFAIIQKAQEPTAAAKREPQQA